MRKVIISQTSFRGHVAARKLGLGRHEYRVATHKADLQGVNASEMVIALGGPVFRESMFWDLVAAARIREKRERVEIPMVEL